MPGQEQVVPGAEGVDLRRRLERRDRPDDEGVHGRWVALCGDRGAPVDCPEERSVGPPRYLEAHRRWVRVVLLQWVEERLPGLRGQIRRPPVPEQAAHVGVV